MKIKFFTQESLAVLFNRNEYDIVNRHTESGNYGRQQLEVGWLLVKKGPPQKYRPTSQHLLKNYCGQGVSIRVQEAAD